MMDFYFKMALDPAETLQQEHRFQQTPRPIPPWPILHRTIEYEQNTSWKILKNINKSILKIS